MDSRLRGKDNLLKTMDFLRARVKHCPKKTGGGQTKTCYSLKHRKGGNYGYEAHLDIMRGGKLLASITRGPTDGYRHRAYSFTPDGKTIISGGANGVLSSYDLAGDKLGDFIGHTGEVWALTPSPDGRLLLSGSADQTVRLWNIKTRELIVTLFHGCALSPSPKPSPPGERASPSSPGREKKPRSNSEAVAPQKCEWAMWTPQGYYTSSANGRGLVGWQLNRGADKAADHLSGEQLHKYLYSPEIINRAIILGSAVKAIRELGGNEDVLARALAGGMPPKVRILTRPGATHTRESLTVRAGAEDRGGGIGKVEWRVNGVTLGVEDRGWKAVRGGNIKRRFALEPGENIIELVVYNKQGGIASKPDSTRVRYKPTVEGQRPALHVLTVGVNDYWDSALKLNYSVPDATALGEALKKGGLSTKGGEALYRAVHVTRLIDKQVNAKKLAGTFKALSKVIKPRDVFVFFIAGHGVTKGGHYYYLPQDVRYSNDKQLIKQAISQDMWQRWFAMIPARKSVLLYDTCESGSMTTAPGKKRGVEQVAAINRLIHATGRAVISATTDDAPALEGYRGHGMFTYTLLEALARGDHDGDGLVELTELTSHVDRRVPQLSFERFKFRQVPRFDLNGMNYTLAKVQPDAAPGGGKGGSGGGGAGAIPLKATHVVILPAQVRAKPEARADVLRRLEPGVSVTKIRQGGGFMLIAKDGKRMGYVDSGRLAPLR